MSNVIALESQEACFDEASLWIAKLDNELSAQEKLAFQQWVTKDEENHRVLMKMAEVWDKMDDLARLSDLFPKNQGTGQESRFSMSTWGNYVAAAAAVMVITLLSVHGMLQAPNSSVESGQVLAVAGLVENTYETAVGERSTITLSDGSLLTLNTNSAVKVHYANEYRLLKLERGEIHIQVAHHRQRPLSVWANNKLVQAVGTAFNVEINSDQSIELVVTEGKVLVAVHQAQQGERLVPPVLGTGSMAVSRGEQVLLSEVDGDVSRIDSEDIKVKLSWREGDLIFQGESLADAMAEINRYTQVEFIIVDEELKQVRIAGLFRAGDVDGLLSALRKNFNITSRRTGDGKVLLSPK